MADVSVPDLRWQGSTITETALYAWAKSGTAIVVLERLARGGGATRWYVADDTSQLRDVVSRLRPGSCVSFYRDGRIKRAPFGDEVEVELMEDIVRDGDALLGWRIPGIPELAMEVVSGPMDMSELAVEATAQSEVFYGAVPGRDNDGVNAITLVLPDADGVRRDHPH
jgi:hypothetical protein